MAMELQITIDPAIVPVKSMVAVPRPPHDSYRRSTNARLVEFDDGALSSSAYKIDVHYTLLVSSMLVSGRIDLPPRT